MSYASIVRGRTMRGCSYTTFMRIGKATPWVSMEGLLLSLNRTVLMRFIIEATGQCETYPTLVHD